MAIRLYAWLGRGLGGGGTERRAPRAFEFSGLASTQIPGSAVSLTRTAARLCGRPVTCETHVYFPCRCGPYVLFTYMFTLHRSARTTVHGRRLFFDDATHDRTMCPFA